MITEQDIKNYNDYTERFNKLLLIFNITVPSNKQLVTKALKPTKLGFWDGIYRAIYTLNLRGVTINCKESYIMLEARHCAMNFSIVTCLLKNGFLDQLCAKPFEKAVPNEVNEAIKSYYDHLTMADQCKNRLPRPLMELI